VLNTQNNYITINNHYNISLQHTRQCPPQEKKWVASCDGTKMVQ